MFAQPVVTVWLSSAEYDALRSLPGRDLSKRRYYDEQNDECAGLVISIDVFQGELEGLILCETETESLDAWQAAQFPQYARREVTEDRFFTGGSLCRPNRLQIEPAIRRAFSQ